MFDVTVMIVNDPKHTKRVYGREAAETWATMAYDCDNVYAVEIVSAETGELIYYKSKG
jgi:hypothetical protein